MTEPLDCFQCYCFSISFSIFCSTPPHPPPVFKLAMVERGRKLVLKNFFYGTTVDLQYCMFPVYRKLVQLQICCTRFFFTTVNYYKILNIDPCVCVCAQSCPVFCDPMDCSPPSSWDSPGKNTGMDCHFLPHNSLCYIVNLCSLFYI